MLEAAHDSLGHQGTYAAKELLLQRFWWPELERNVHWYVKTCHMCQKRQKKLVQIPRIETHTPLIFQQLHADTIHMDKSGRFKYIIHGRCVNILARGTGASCRKFESNSRMVVPRYYLSMGMSKRDHHRQWETIYCSAKILRRKIWN
jgi:hypothetical protein